MIKSNIILSGLVLALSVDTPGGAASAQSVRGAPPIEGSGCAQSDEAWRSLRGSADIEKVRRFRDDLPSTCSQLRASATARLKALETQRAAATEAAAARAQEAATLREQQVQREQALIQSGIAGDYSHSLVDCVAGEVARRIEVVGDKVSITLNPNDRPLKAWGGLRQSDGQEEHFVLGGTNYVLAADKAMLWEGDGVLRQGYSRCNEETKAIERARQLNVSAAARASGLLGTYKETGMWFDSCKKDITLYLDSYELMVSFGCFREGKDRREPILSSSPNQIETTKAWWYLSGDTISRTEKLPNGGRGRSDAHVRR